MFKQNSNLQLASKKNLIGVGLIPVLVAAIIALIIFFLFKYLPSSLPLFYSLPWGEDQLATHNQFFTIPIIIAVVSSINLALALNLHPTQVFFRSTLIISSVVTSLLLTITLIRIITIFI